MSSEEKLLTVEDCAAYFQVSVRKLYDMIKFDKLPGTKVCSLWRFDRNKLQKWVDRHTPHNPTEEEPPTLLVVEDEPTILEILKEGFTDQLPGWRIVTADDGVYAMVMVGLARPKAIILDVELPEIDGIEICRRLKNHEETKDTFVVAITGHTHKGYEKRCLEAGADVFFEKPVKFAEVAEKIKEAVTQRTPA